MRLTVLLITAALTQLHAASIAQNITLTGRQLSPKAVFSAIEQQTGYLVMGNKRLVENIHPITVTATNMPINDFLQVVFKDQAIDYLIKGNSIILFPRKSAPAPSPEETTPPATAPPPVKFSIKAVDSTGAPLIGATITIQGKKTHQLTGPGGIADLEIEEGDVIEISYVGYLPYQHKVTSRDAGRTIEFRLSPKRKAMSEVVISSGFVNRRAETFTGAAVTVTQEELLRNGNENILQSLKSIDPSFRLIENMDMGSNPNTMPEIVLRGKTNMPDLTGTYSGNPNQPLFILDGFETDLQRIYDLDMNRVKTVTLLKDAVAKAIYGAKAGNGVVVVETIQPQPGRMRLSYNGNLNIEAPDLTGYNLMNAREKLQWEKDHSMWTAGLSDIYSARQNMYNLLYQDVYAKGVNTYWLSKPLQTGIGQKHSLNLEGGDDRMRYGASFMYNNITGAMKGSERNTYTGSTTLSYRYKNLLFRNAIEFSQNTATNSKYGAFSQYTQLNPYWTPYDDNGNIKMYAGYYPEGTTVFTMAINPLYNAALNIIDQSTYAQYSDNFQMEWRINNKLRFNGSFGYMHQNFGSDYFLPPDHTDFLNYTQDNGLIDYKGNWTKMSGVARTLESNLGINYTQSFGRHLLIANTTLNITDFSNRSNTMEAEGFGNDFISDISLAHYYQRASSPGGSDSRARTIGAVGILNYSYANRFIMDATYRTNASSQYGANARWGNFWALGAGWNLHSEPFIRQMGFQTLRIRGSIGYTGSQNANSYAALSTNQYTGVVYDGQTGTSLIALPNPNLAWQKNMDYNLGLDVALWENKLSARAELYKKVTTNLVTDITAPPSFGFTSYLDNLGKTENTGYELSLRYQVFNQPKDRAFLNINIGATHNKNRLVSISDAFKAYNDQQDKNVTSGNTLYTKPVARYYEGQSLDAIWAMKSLGIDPATGNELFLDKTGHITYTWSANDLIIAGDAQPKLNGIVGFNAGYKGFVLSTTFNYQFGGQIYNGTLVSKVENVDGRSNLDKRILQAWSKPGDVAIYKKPQVSSTVNSISYTRPTSRFVQNNNEWYISTVNLSYEVQSQRLLRKLGMDRLKATFYTNELLRISSIQTERGTSYPFARNFSFSLNASF